MHSGTCLNSTSDYEQSHCDLHLDLSSDETRPTTASLFAGEVGQLIYSKHTQVSLIIHHLFIPAKFVSEFFIVIITIIMSVMFNMHIQKLL